MDPYLFKHGTQVIYSSDLLEMLRKFEADQCDVLYVHTGMQFGLPNIKLGRSALLDLLADILYKLNVSTIIMPTYTFSFCNSEVFDREKTPSSMGALNEYLRKHHYWKRSRDPLMSNIVYGKEQSLVTNIGKNSVGRDSTFDLLAKSGHKVKFLFMGPCVHDCFTYMHYLEDVKKVPYRYDFEFSGTIIDGELTYEDKYTLFIRDAGVEAGGGAKIYENILIERGLAKFESVGGGAITVLDLESAQETYLELLDKSPNFYINKVFQGPIRPNTFANRKMVAL